MAELGWKNWVVGQKNPEFSAFLAFFVLVGVGPFINNDPKGQKGEKRKEKVDLAPAGIEPRTLPARDQHSTYFTTEVC